MTKMRGIAGKRPWLLLVLLALALSAATAGAAFGATKTDPLVLRSVVVDEYPKISLSVGLPGAIAPGGVPKFAVRENGQPVDVLSVTADRRDLPFEVVLVIDTSGSMRGRPIEDARAAARRFIDLMPPQASLAIVGISSEPKQVSGFASSKAALRAAVSSLGASGETALYDSALLASRLKGIPGNGTAKLDRTIVLLSDGGDTTSVTTLDQVVRSLRDANVPVLAVAIQSPEFNQQALRLLSHQSGGRMSTVKDTGDLEGYFGGLAQEIATGYTLVFRSARPGTKDLDIDVTATSGEEVASLSTVVPNPMFVARLPASLNPYSLPAPNRLLLWAAVLAAAAAVGAAAFAVLMYFFGRRANLAHVRYYDQLRGETTHSGNERESVQSRLVDAVDAVASRHGLTGVIAAKLERAGIPLRPAEWISLHIVGVVVIGFLVEAIVGNIAIGLISVLVLTWAPLAYLDHRGARRAAAFDEQLPDVLNLLSGGLRTGWGLQQAMELVVNEGSPPASDEFRRAQIEARLGVPLDRALLNINARVQSEPFEWVVTAIAIQREVGGNLAEVLDNVSTSIRDRESLYRLVASLTAEGRYSALILEILPFVVVGMLFVVNRDYLMSAMMTPFGWVLAALVAVLLVFGIVWLRVVSRIEY